MATLTYKRYHDSGAVKDVNRYISDGHGDSAPERTNRYISDGHGGTTICRAYNCPDDPDAATAYMNTLRLQYELQHPELALVQGKSKQRQAVVHLQFFLSFAEYEDLSVDEMMEITDELLKESGLADEYALRASPHENTWRPDDLKNPGNKHVHVSGCPYSLDGTHKLSMTYTLQWDLQKKLDHICVDRGYSIIAKPILLADPEYREWFEGVAKEGKVIIHPQQTESKKKRTGKSKERNQDTTERDKAKLKKRSEIRAYNLMLRLDIRTPAELRLHIKGIGGDISDLRQEIAYQTRVLDSMEPQMAAIRVAEGKDTSAPKRVSESLKIASEGDIKKIKLKYRRAKDRLALCEKKLESRNKEYGQLKRAQNALGPELWEAIAADTKTPCVGYGSDNDYRNTFAEVETQAEENNRRLLEQLAEEQRRKWYVNDQYVSRHTKRPYRVPRNYPGDWRPLSFIEMIFLLAAVVISKEGDFWTTSPPPGQENVAYFGKPDYKIQRMLDAIEISREEGVSTISEINDRIDSVGYQLGKCNSDDERKELKERYRNLNRLKEDYYHANSASYCFGPAYVAPIREAEPVKKSVPAQEKPTRKLPALDAVMADAASRSGKPKTVKKKDHDLEK